MVKLRKVEKQNVTEAKQVGTLYHVCTLDALVNYIIPNNELRASGKYWNKLLKTDQQVCFTRDPLFVVPTWTVNSGNILFQFVVDGDKLSEKYKITPFNYTTNPNQRYREKEEDVIGPIKNFKSYVKEVRFDIKDLDVEEDNIQGIINKLEDVKKYLTSIKCRRSELPFLDSHWNVKFGKVKNPKYEIKTLDDFITILKSYTGSGVLEVSIDTPDLFVKYLDSLSSTQVENIIKEHPTWVKYVNIFEVYDNNNNNNNNLDLVKLLVKNGADVNIKNEYGSTPLIIACEKNNYELTKLFVDNGADVNVSDYEGNTPLIIVCYHNNLDMAKLFIENGADVNVKDKDGDTLLMKACYHGTYDYNGNYYELIKLLIENGADVNVRDSEGDTTLFTACSHDNFDVAKLLIEHGADVNVRDNEGDTPLIIACYHDNLDVAKLLIENGADVNVMGNEEDTSLSLACDNNNLDMVKLLIENGADIKNIKIANCRNGKIKDYIRDVKNKDKKK